MRSIKRNIALLLLLALMFTILPGAALADTDTRITGKCGDSVNFTFYKQAGATYGSLSLAGSGPMYDYSNSNPPPWEEYCKEINIISLAEGITTVGSLSFIGCRNVTRVILPPSLKKIGYLAFYNCYNLTTIESGIPPEYKEELPQLLEEIGSEAFMNCRSLKKIVLPNSVTDLRGETFSGCTSLESVWLSNNLVSVGGSAFEGCTSLRNIVIPDKVQYIFINAFKSCQNLRVVINSMKYYVCDTSGRFLTVSADSGIEYFGDPSQIRLAAPRYSPTQRYAEMLGYSFTETGLPPNPFKDVYTDKFYYESVLWAYYQDPKITSGTTDTTFEPETKINRAQAVTFLWNAAGKPAPGSSSNPFNDVSSDAYYYKAVLWAYRKGITSGTTDTTFEPDKSCTRAEVVTFLWKAMGKPSPKTTKNPFPDVKKGTWYYKAVLWAYENKIVSGFDDGTFGTNKTCTRGQFVTFLRRFVTKFPDALQ